MTDVIHISRLAADVFDAGGETGRPAAIVELSGCSAACLIGTQPEVLEFGGTAMPVGEAARELSGMHLDQVAVMGGEPLRQPGCLPLIGALRERGKRIILESNATLDLDAVPEYVTFAVELLCPSLGSCYHTEWDSVQKLRRRDSILFTIADRGDYVWARDVIQRENLAELTALFMRPRKSRLDPAELAHWMQSDRLPARLQYPLFSL